MQKKKKPSKFMRIVPSFHTTIQAHIRIDCCRHDDLISEVVSGLIFRQFSCQSVSFLHLNHVPYLLVGNADISGNQLLTVHNSIAINAILHFFFLIVFFLIII